METKDNVHQGHRARMLAKALCGANAFLDHEKLEVLLFFVLPRKDTNPLAHRILKKFGTLDRVFEASAEELKMVEGVGDSIAEYLMVLGAVMRTIMDEKEEEVFISSPGECKIFADKLFKGKTTEHFFLVLLDKNKRLITRIKFEDNNKSKVSADIPDISNALSMHKPAYAIIMHNHPSGVTTPSPQDDLATKKINLLCEIVGTNLIDHLIYTEEKIYSYTRDGHMSEIKSMTVNKVLNSVKGDML